MGLIALSTVGPLVLVLACIGVSALFGWISLDLIHFSAFQATLNAPIEEDLLWPVVLTQLAVIPFAAIFNALPALGEELGWRGWLVPALAPLGLWPTLVLSGALWGVWHAPLTLLGHNFDEPNVWGVLLMTIGSIAWGVLFGWLRLRADSIWPVVIAHGSLNASANLVLIVGSADAPLDLTLVNPVGVSGWIVLLVVVGILALTGQFRRGRLLSYSRSTRSSP